MIELIANALFIVGLNYATSFSYCSDIEIGQPHYGKDGIDKTSLGILWFLRYRAEKLIGSHWTKPLFSCIMCMSSVWGTAGYLITHDHYSVMSWIIYVGILAGIGTIIDRYLHGKLY